MEDMAHHPHIQAIRWRKWHHSTTKVMGKKTDHHTHTNYPLKIFRQHGFIGKLEGIVALMKHNEFRSHSILHTNASNHSRFNIRKSALHQVAGSHLRAFLE